MNADNWYVRTATGESIGPLSEAHVREMLLRTTDLQGTKVRQGNSAWIDASYVLNRFKELMEQGVYLAHQNQTLGPFTTEHANNLLRQHATISKYRIGENGEWKALDSSRTIKAPADNAPTEPQPSPKPKQATPAPKTAPAKLGGDLKDIRLETGVPIQRPVDDSSTQFDPYRVWLGLPKGLKHPTYYHILGITQGESSVDVIRSAIEQRRSYILSKRGEGHDRSVQQILSMIEEAAATLLVPEFKHGYDRYISSHLKEKRKPNRRSYILPSWMESRVVRTYGEGSGIVGDLLGIVAVLFGAFAFMAILSFTLQSRATKSDEPRELTWMEKAAGVTSTEVADPAKAPELAGLKDPIKKKGEDAERMVAAKAEADRIAAAEAKSMLAEPSMINSISLALKKLPAGTFVMGEGSEAHEVILTKPFYIGVWEVTQQQYQRVMGTNPSHFTGALHPVEEVSWEDAAEFCRKLSEMPEEKKAGRVYRLPTEAEWEYACRAGATTKFSFGDDESKLSEYAWYDKNSGNKTHTVCEKKPNAWGLYDMHGNVWEWCSDWYGDYPKGAVQDPQGPSQGSVRVKRGGGWALGAAFCRSADRNGNVPSYRSSPDGFRVALSIETARGKELEELAAAKSTRIVTVTPADAKVLVTGNGVTITGSGNNRVVSIENPMGEYRLIATMDGYKPFNIELQPQKGSTQTSVVMLERMQEVVSGNAPSARSHQITFSSVSVIVKEDGTGKVIVDTRPPDQLEPLKPLAQPITGSAFFGSAEVEKVGENRHHLRYDFSKFRALSELRSLQMTPEMFSTLRIDADENALILTPIKPPYLGFKLSQPAFPLMFRDDFAVRVNLLGANQGQTQLQFFFHPLALVVTLHGSDSPKKEPPGTVVISELQGKSPKVLAKTVTSVDQKNEVYFKLQEKLRTIRFKMGYTGDTPIGISSIDLIADFQPTYGVELQMQGTKITVKQVFPGTSGDLAGIKAGDQLKTINGTSPKDIETALQFFADADIEKELPIEVVRLGRTRTLMLKPGGVTISP